MIKFIIDKELKEIKNKYFIGKLSNVNLDAYLNIHNLGEEFSSTKLAIFLIYLKK